MLMNVLKDWMIVMIMPHVLILLMATPVPVTLGTQAVEQSVKVSLSYRLLVGGFYMHRGQQEIP